MSGDDTGLCLGCDSPFREVVVCGGLVIWLGRYVCSRSVPIVERCLKSGGATKVV